jgi:hypothetical protein
MVFESLVLLFESLDTDVKPFFDVRAFSISLV